MDRYQLLVFSFYREEPKIQAALQPLLKCRIIRGNKSICIECLDAKNLAKVSPLVGYLRTPLLAIGIAQEIVLTISVSTQKDYLSQKQNLFIGLSKDCYKKTVKSLL